MDTNERTRVVNLLDDRTGDYDLPPDKAVVAAYEQSKKANYDLHTYPEPESHPHFREYSKGYSCGDWIARKKHEQSFAS